jgi:hypothetical protein
MTMDNTTATLTLNSHGWTGTLTVHATSATHAYLNTDGAHVNDTSPAATRRGARYLISADLRRTLTGWEVTTRPYGCRKSDGTMRNDRPLTAREEADLHSAILEDVLHAASSGYLTDAMHAAEGRRLADAVHAAERAEETAWTAARAARSATNAARNNLATYTKGA